MDRLFSGLEHIERLLGGPSGKSRKDTNGVPMAAASNVPTAQAVTLPIAAPVGAPVEPEIRPPRTDTKRWQPWQRQLLYFGVPGGILLVLGVLFLGLLFGPARRQEQTELDNTGQKLEMKTSQGYSGTTSIQAKKEDANQADAKKAEIKKEELKKSAFEQEEPKKEQPTKQEKPKKEPDKKEAEKPSLLVVPPTGGKEVRLVDWRFTNGTRLFSLTDATPVKPNAKMPPLEEYLEFREEKSTTFANGILTLIPLSSMRKMNYDRKNKTVAVSVLHDSGEAVLIGTTRFVGINKVTLEANAILDGLGAATVKFHGGLEMGLRSIIFPDPKAAAPAKGAVTTIIAEDTEGTKHVACDLQPLYKSDGQYRVLPYLMFNKTVRINLDKIAAMRSIASVEKNKISSNFEVTLRDGVKHTLTLLTEIDLSDKKSASLEGLVGRVPAGYKLFPPHTIHDLLAGE
jgi:hypothetical protein